VMFAIMCNCKIPYITDAGLVKNNAAIKELNLNIRILVNMPV
jgi:hypothetical protein